MLFEVTADDIKLLDDADLRQLVARLCEQELRARGHSSASVTAGGHQDAPDGGIDVRVSLPDGAAISGYVPSAASGFQVKAQKMRRQEIIDEMAPEGTLRPSVAALAAAGGAYVIVSSGDSVSDSNLLNAAKICALLYSFDGETLTGEASELAVLADLAAITTDQLFAHVAELKRRQLVQKRGQWRAILPHAIAHSLAKLALEDIPFEKIEAAVMNSGSERIIRSFSKRMGYLHDNESAKKLVAKWLAEGGWLDPIGSYNELGAACFTNIAPVDPEMTLAFVERAAASRSDWFFGEKNLNRSMIVRVLRSIAYDASLFERAMALLKKFAIDKSDDRHDSASEEFKSLFMMYLSGTHATPAQRAKVIRSLLT